MDYTLEEKKIILDHYLNFYQVPYQLDLIHHFAEKVASVPREIHNFVIKVRDYVISKKITILTSANREHFLKHTQIEE